MLAPTHLEPGCELYEVYESDAEGRFYFYEIWESQAALDEHAATPHYRHLQQMLGELLEEPFEINLSQRFPSARPPVKTFRGCRFAREPFISPDFPFSSPGL